MSLRPSVPTYRYTVKGLDLTETVVELRKSFRDVVDTYLADREATGKQPKRPYNGTIIVRVDPEIHRRVAMKAAASRKSMNKHVQSLLEKATEDFVIGP